jgi:hypothetical protein
MTPDHSTSDKIADALALLGGVAVSQLATPRNTAK